MKHAFENGFSYTLIQHLAPALKLCGSAGWVGPFTFSFFVRLLVCSLCYVVFVIACLIVWRGLYLGSTRLLPASFYTDSNVFSGFLRLARMLPFVFLNVPKLSWAFPSCPGLSEASRSFRSSLDSFWHPVGSILFALGTSLHLL